MLDTFLKNQCFIMCSFTININLENMLLKQVLIICNTLFIGYPLCKRKCQHFLFSWLFTSHLFICLSPTIQKCSIIPNTLEAKSIVLATWWIIISRWLLLYFRLSLCSQPTYFTGLIMVLFDDYIKWFWKGSKYSYSRKKSLDL